MLRVWYNRKFVAPPFAGAAPNEKHPSYTKGANKFSMLAMSSFLALISTIE